MKVSLIHKGKLVYYGQRIDLRSGPSFSLSLSPLSLSFSLLVLATMPPPPSAPLRCCLLLLSLLLLTTVSPASASIDLISVLAAGTGPMAGLDVGDTVTLTFSAQTNQPAVATAADAGALVAFTPFPLGDFTGRWGDAGRSLVLTLTSINATTVAYGRNAQSAGAATAAAYSASIPSNTIVAVKSAGGLRGVGETAASSSSAASTPSARLAGTWGEYTTPMAMLIALSALYALLLVGLLVVDREKGVWLVLKNVNHHLQARKKSRTGIAARTPVVLPVWEDSDDTSSGGGGNSSSGGSSSSNGPTFSLVPFFRPLSLGQGLREHHSRKRTLY